MRRTHRRPDLVSRVFRVGQVNVKHSDVDASHDGTRHRARRGSGHHEGRDIVVHALAARGDKCRLLASASTTNEAGKKGQRILVRNLDHVRSFAFEELPEWSESRRKEPVGQDRAVSSIGHRTLRCAEVHDAGEAPEVFDAILRSRHHQRHAPLVLFRMAQQRAIRRPDAARVRTVGIRQMERRGRHSPEPRT